MSRSVLRPLALSAVFAASLAILVERLYFWTPADPWLLIRLADLGFGRPVAVWHWGRLGGLVISSMLFSVLTLSPLRDWSHIRLCGLLTVVTTLVAMAFVWPEIDSVIGKPGLLEVTPGRALIFRIWDGVPGGDWGRRTLLGVALAACSVAASIAKGALDGRRPSTR